MLSHHSKIRQLIAAAVLVFCSIAANEIQAESSEGRFILSPLGDPYKPYLADPNRVGFEITTMSYHRSEIPDSGKSRAALKAGGRVGFVRYDPPGYEDEGWQIGMEFGYIGEFDLDRNYDNVGWDGVYGLLLTGPLTRRLLTKLGVVHRSSHVGDEYSERNGRRRLNYTRQEMLLGLSWDIVPTWRVYAEYGRAFDLGNPVLQADGRAQIGLEYHPKEQWFNKRVGWFTALDLSAWEERDWQTDTSYRIGYEFDGEGARWTLSLVYHHGRPSISEFFQHTESYTGISLKVDL
jgi:hypothetical protein